MNKEIIRDLFDHRDGDLYWKERPSNRVDVSKPAGYVKHNGYKQIKIKNKNYLTHRLIWLYVHGKFPENTIDHINGIRHDNNIENLRDVSQKENNKNKAKHKNNTSGYVGVCWNRDSDKWMARIAVDGKLKYLGLFNILEDAAAARQQADIKYNFHENHGRTL